MSTKHKKTDDPSEVHLPSTWTPVGRLSKALVVPPHTAENRMAACTKDSFSMNGFFSQRAVCLPLSPKSTPFRELSGEVRMSSSILIATHGWQDFPQSRWATAASSQRRDVREAVRRAGLKYSQGLFTYSPHTSPCTHSCNYFLFPVRLDLLCANPSHSFC